MQRERSVRLVEEVSEFVSLLHHSLTQVTLAEGRAIMRFGGGTDVHTKDMSDLPETFHSFVTILIFDARNNLCW